VQVRNHSLRHHTRSCSSLTGRRGRHRLTRRPTVGKKKNGSWGKKIKGRAKRGEKQKPVPRDQTLPHWLKFTLGRKTCPDNQKEGSKPKEHANKPESLALQGKRQAHEKNRYFFQRKERQNLGERNNTTRGKGTRRGEMDQITGQTYA